MWSWALNLSQLEICNGSIAHRLTTLLRSALDRRWKKEESNKTDLCRKYLFYFDLSRPRAKNEETHTRYCTLAFSTEIDQCFSLLSSFKWFPAFFEKGKRLRRSQRSAVIRQLHTSNHQFVYRFQPTKFFFSFHNCAMNSQLIYDSKRHAFKPRLL